MSAAAPVWADIKIEAQGVQVTKISGGTAYTARAKSMNILVNPLRGEQPVTSMDGEDFSLETKLDGRLIRVTAPRLESDALVARLPMGFVVHAGPLRVSCPVGTWKKPTLTCPQSVQMDASTWGAHAGQFMINLSTQEMLLSDTVQATWFGSAESKRTVIERQQRANSAQKASAP